MPRGVGRLANALLVHACGNKFPYFLGEIASEWRRDRTLTNLSTSGGAESAVKVPILRSHPQRERLRFNR